jgi:hypothetical protein
MTVVAIADRLIDPRRPDETRFRHVVKHLYALRQRWDLAIPEMPHNPRLRARSAGCLSRDLDHPVWPDVCQSCREQVLGDDARWYCPASLDAVRTGLASPHHAVVDTAQGRREMIVGDNAVIVLLGHANRAGEQVLLTAYRDPPGGRSPTQEQFLAKAVRKLRDKASLGSGAPS